MNIKLVKLNVLWAVSCQIITMISGFIIPRMILSTFGSEANGLIASINQFLNYVSILEGGVSGVAVAALYKPLQQNDKEKINKVVNAIRNYFVRLGFLCIGFTIVIAYIYPRIIATKYDYNYLSLLILVLGGRLVIQYCLSITFRILLKADQKVYYISIVQIIITIVHLFLIVFSIKCFDDVLTVYAISGISYFFQPVFYFLYIKKYYNIQYIKAVDKEALQQKKAGFGQNLAYFIHTNTDIVLLSLFATLSDVSVYTVYLMIANAINGMIVTISSAIVPSIGNLLAKNDREECNKAFNKYEFAIVLITFVAYSCALELVFPFVSVYTQNISDAEYMQPLFGVLLLLAEMAYCIRDPYINIAYASGHFKQTSKYAYIEASINILISIVLVQYLGLIGVAIGTLISMSIRVIQHIFYLKRNILMINPLYFIKKILIYGAATTIIILISRLLIPQYMTSFLIWTLYASFALVCTCLIFYALNYILYKKQIKYCVDYFIFKKGIQ